MSNKRVKAFENRFAKLWLDDEGIAHVYFKINSDISHEEFTEYMANAAKLSDGKPMPVIVNVSDIGFITDSAMRQVLNEQTKKITKAAAIIVSSPSVRVRFYIHALVSLKKPPFPIKVFIDEKKAAEWLRGFT